MIFQSVLARDEIEGYRYVKKSDGQIMNKLTEESRFKYEITPSYEYPEAIQKKEKYDLRPNAYFLFNYSLEGNTLSVLNKVTPGIGKRESFISHAYIFEGQNQRTGLFNHGKGKTVFDVRNFAESNSDIENLDANNLEIFSDEVRDREYFNNMFVYFGFNTNNKLIRDIIFLTFYAYTYQKKIIFIPKSCDKEFSEQLLALFHYIFMALPIHITQHVGFATYVKTITGSDFALHSSVLLIGVDNNANNLNKYDELEKSGNFVIDFYQEEYPNIGNMDVTDYFIDAIQREIFIDTEEKPLEDFYRFLLKNTDQQKRLSFEFMAGLYYFYKGSSNAGLLEQAFELILDDIHLVERSFLYEKIINPIHDILEQKIESGKLLEALPLADGYYQVRNEDDWLAKIIADYLLSDAQNRTHDYTNIINENISGELADAVNGLIISEEKYIDVILYQLEEQGEALHDTGKAPVKIINLAFKLLDTYAADMPTVLTNQRFQIDFKNKIIMPLFNDRNKNLENYGYFFEKSRKQDKNIKQMKGIIKSILSSVFSSFNEYVSQNSYSYQELVDVVYQIDLKLLDSPEKKIKKMLEGALKADLDKFPNYAEYTFGHQDYQLEEGMQEILKDVFSNFRELSHMLPEEIQKILEEYRQNNPDPISLQELCMISINNYRAYIYEGNSKKRKQNSKKNPISEFLSKNASYRNDEKAQKAVFTELQDLISADKSLLANLIKDKLLDKLFTDFTFGCFNEMLAFIRENGNDNLLLNYLKNKDNLMVYSDAVRDFFKTEPALKEKVLKESANSKLHQILVGTFIDENYKSKISFLFKYLLFFLDFSILSLWGLNIFYLRKYNLENYVNNTDVTFTNYLVFFTFIFCIAALFIISFFFICVKFQMDTNGMLIYLMANLMVGLIIFILPISILGKDTVVDRAFGINTNLKSKVTVNEIYYLYEGDIKAIVPDNVLYLSVDTQDVEFHLVVENQIKDSQFLITLNDNELVKTDIFMNGEFSFVVFNDALRTGNNHFEISSTSPKDIISNRTMYTINKKSK